MKLATLGPHGTCSEEVSIAYLTELGVDASQCLELYPSFEAAVEAVLAGAADKAVVPAAYVRFHEIVFANLGDLCVGEVLFSKTPAFLLAGKPPIALAVEGKEYSIASHKSPAPLLSRLTFSWKMVEAPSNAAAAWQAANGETDFCLTNKRALVEVNGTESNAVRLELIEYFGAVDMVWAVFERGQRNRDKNYWSGHFDDELALSPVSVEHWKAEEGLEAIDTDSLQGALRIRSTTDPLGEKEDLPAIRPTALFVDNDPDAFKLVPETFDSWDWLYAQTADEASAIIEEHLITVALVDIGLIRDRDQSDRSGTALLESIRQTTPDTPVLMITGLMRSDDLAAICFRLGALDYMKKPLDADRLSAWLDLLHRRWRASMVSTPCTIERRHLA